MDIIRFFSLAPRVTIVRWLAICAGSLGILWLCVLALARVEGIVLVATYAVLGITLMKLAVESTRRLHDCGQSGKLGCAIAAGVAALFVTGCLHWMQYGPDPIFWGAWALATCAVAIACLRSGMRAVNSYGPPPAGFLPSAAPPAKTGIVITIGIVIVSIGFGVAVLNWQDAIDRDRERRTRIDNGHDAFPAPMSLAESIQSNDIDDETMATSNQIDAMLNRGDAR